MSRHLAMHTLCSPAQPLDFDFSQIAAQEGSVSAGFALACDTGDGVF